MPATGLSTAPLTAIAHTHLFCFCQFPLLHQHPSQTLPHGLVLPGGPGWGGVVGQSKAHMLSLTQQTLWRALLYVCSGSKLLCHQVQL